MEYLTQRFLYISQSIWPDQICQSSKVRLSQKVHHHKHNLALVFHLHPNIYNLDPRDPV